MSTLMVWRPVLPKPNGEEVHSKLHRLLAHKFFDSDGSLIGKTYVGRAQLPYLEGLRDATPILEPEVREQLFEIIGTIRLNGGVELEIIP